MRSASSTRPLTIRYAACSSSVATMISSAVPRGISTMLCCAELIVCQIISASAPFEMMLSDGPCASASRRAGGSSSRAALPASVGARQESSSLMNSGTKSILISPERPACVYFVWFVCVA